MSNAINCQPSLPSLNMTISEFIQTLASLLAILFAIEQTYQRLRHVPPELANRWLTTVYQCKEIIDASISSGGSLSSPWKLGDSIIDEHDLYIKLDEIRSEARSKQIRSSVLKLQEAIRKIWASSQPSIPVVYFLDEFNELHSSSDTELSVKFKELQLQAAEVGRTQTQALLQIINKRKAKT